MPAPDSSTGIVTTGAGALCDS